MPGSDILKVCRRCGLSVKTTNPPEKCHAICAKRGLGDYVAMGLAAFGIKPKKNCGCKKRQMQLNEIGDKFGV